MESQCISANYIRQFCSGNFEIFCHCNCCGIDPAMAGRCCLSACMVAFLVRGMYAAL